MEKSKIETAIKFSLPMFYVCSGATGEKIGEIRKVIIRRKKLTPGLYHRFVGERKLDYCYRNQLFKYLPLAIKASHRMINKNITSVIIRAKAVKP